MTGRMYWSEKQVRVWTMDGKFLDLGKRSLESSRAVAREFDFKLIVQPCAPAIRPEQNRLPQTKP